MRLTHAFVTAEGCAVSAADLELASAARSDGSFDLREVRAPTACSCSWCCRKQMQSVMRCKAFGISCPTHCSLNCGTHAPRVYAERQTISSQTLFCVRSSGHRRWATSPLSAKA